MLPNLTIIITAYVVVRLITIALRQFPEAEKMLVCRGAVFALSLVGIVVALYCMFDTIVVASRAPKGMLPM